MKLFSWLSFCIGLFVFGFGFKAKTENQLEFKVLKHVIAKKVGFDKKGTCKAANGRAIKIWRVPGFPATIPHFESCLTVQSPNARGLVDFEKTLYNKQGEEIMKVEGAVELGITGSASQAVNWDHLEIEKPGIYHMVTKLADKQVSKVSLKFVRVRHSNKKTE